MLRLIRAGKQFGLWNQPGAIYRYHALETVSRQFPLRTLQFRMALTDQVQDYLKAKGALDRDCRRALYGVRLEAARAAWNSDTAYAADLAKKAVGLGRWWVTGSPALPLQFQLAFFFLDFRLAQKLADARRKLS